MNYKNAIKQIQNWFKTTNHKNNYTTQYFINKFSAIPDDKWIMGQLTDGDDKTKHCALGHCGMTRSNILYAPKEAKALIELMGGNSSINSYNESWSFVTRWNDGILGDNKLTPKQRMINRLMELEKNSAMNVSKRTWLLWFNG